MIGFVLLMLAIVVGRAVAESPTWAPLFTFTGTQLAWMLIVYGFIASVLPVWLLLAPRDYLSTFLKIGTIVALGDRHPVRRARAADAGRDPVHRRHRPGLVGQPVPVPVHHHRLRRGVGLPRADLLGHDAEDDRERDRTCASSATARMLMESLRRDHGADRRHACSTRASISR